MRSFNYGVPCKDSCLLYFSGETIDLIGDSTLSSLVGDLSGLYWLDGLNEWSDWSGDEMVF